MRDGSHPKTEDRLAVLKHSLSKTLTQFYPLAGRIQNRRSVVCNDEGVLYLESQVNVQMLEFLKQPKIELLLPNFLPLSLFSEQPVEESFQVAIKANVFACGGIALGVCVHQTTIDAYAMAAFLKQWAAAAAAAAMASSNNIENQLAYAHVMAASLFPLNESLLREYPEWKTTAVDTEPVGKASTRRFVLDAAAILTLKHKARRKQVPNPSRTELIVGLIWKSCLKASAALSGHSHGPSAVNILVNVRPRIKPPLPDYAIGNIFWSAFPYCDPTSDDADIELPSLVKAIRKSIEEVINGDYIEKIQGEQGHVEFYKRLKQINGIDSFKVESLFWCTSLLSVGFDEVDFGWGKPLWVSSVIKFHWYLAEEYHFLLPAPHVDGVEVWLSLDEHEMGIVEQDSELLSYASINPGIVPDIKISKL